jgi:ribosome-associated heat shock protein Hsp15
LVLCPPILGSIYHEAVVQRAAGNAGDSGQRLDTWLDVACLFKTRSQAQSACRGGKVEVNGERAKPNRLIRPGDEVRITRSGFKQELVVQGLAEHNLPKPEARKLYEDRTPPPSPEELERRRLAKALGLHPGRERAPDKRQRRALRRLKGRRDQ